MIRDYESGSGLRGALRSLIGERVVAVQCVDNIISIFFETRSGVCMRAEDYGIVCLCPLNPDDVSAYIKRLVRATDQRQADLDLAIQVLSDSKCANKPNYAHSGDRGVTTV